MHVGLMAGTIRRKTLGADTGRYCGTRCPSFTISRACRVVACGGSQGDRRPTNHNLGAWRHLQHD